MAYAGLFLSYFKWHYSLALRDFFSVGSSIVWFLYNFFSIPLLTRTLFSPWKKLQERRKRGFDIEDFFAVLLVNLLMRIVGAIVRLATIILGFLAILGFVSVALVMFTVWLLMPLIVVSLIGTGIGFLL